jgi:formylglycine-generating enzyme required for sulfatase activity
MKPAHNPAHLALALALSACTDPSGTPDGNGSKQTPPVENQAAARSSAATTAAPIKHKDAGADASAAKTPPPPLPDEDLYPDSLREQRDGLYRRMEAALRLSSGELAAAREIIERSPVIGLGNPKVTKYPMTRRECREIRAAAGVVDEEKPACGGPFMVPIYNAGAGETEEDAKVCVDRYEFPGVPCEHPVTFATAREAVEICAAVGKRLCDAHEWEGACAGSVRSPEAEYAFGQERRVMTRLHNKNREIIWAYGREKDHSKCATNSRKSKACTSGGWKNCGSNTYPAGAFPACVSPFGVYDLHGNAAEHMNLPMSPEELASGGSTGWTEMKGSWFVFAHYEAHIDDCRWRAPDWHGTKVMDRNSHGNYHLGFRCCKSVQK